MLLLPLTEGFAPFFELLSVGPFILISNACIAFLLNVAAVFLVGVGSGLILTLAGVFKVRRRNVCSQLFEADDPLGHSVNHRFCSSVWLDSHTNTSVWVFHCISGSRAVQNFGW